MGAGASSQGLEEVLTQTFMLGRAIVSCTFPGMYRIYDFHSKRAPKIQNATPFSILGLMDDGEDEDGEEMVKDPSEYSNLFTVKVGNDTVYLENVNEINDGGWIPLHACCMSYQTVDAGKLIIDEMVRLNGNLDVKTITGPGAFNSEWTPLHMACAYGVVPLVSKLLENDANVNTYNSYFCTPLLEACHRGFLEIVKLLVK